MPELREEAISLKSKLAAVRKHNDALQQQLSSSEKYLVREAASAAPASEMHMQLQVFGACDKLVLQCNEQGSNLRACA